MSTFGPSPKPKCSSYEKSTQDNPGGYVTYQCDACKAFPIKDIRYTIGGEVDIGEYLVWNLRHDDALLHSSCCFALQTCVKIVLKEAAHMHHLISHTTH